MYTITNSRTFPYLNTTTDSYYNCNKHLCPNCDNNANFNTNPHSNWRGEWKDCISQKGGRKF